MKAVKLGTLVMEFLKHVNWDQDFDLVLHALYVGFGLSEADIKQHVPVPPHLRDRLDSALHTLNELAERDGCVRGHFPYNPEGAVSAALRWLADEKAKCGALAVSTPTADSEADADADADADTDTDTDTDADLDPALVQLLQTHPVKSYAELRQDFLDNKLKPAPFLVDGLFRLGNLVMLAAMGGLGKTFLGDQLAYCVSTGKDFLGRRTHQMPVLYFDCEMGNADQFVRQAAIAHKLGDDTKPFPVYNRDATMLLKHIAPESIEGILLHDCKHLDLNLRDVFVIFDNFAVAARGRDENTLKDMSLIMAAFRAIVHKHGCPFLLVHHTTKDGFDPRGHSSIRDSLDGLLLLTPASASNLDVCKLSCNKARRSCSFPDERLVRDYVPRFLPSSDPLDTQKHDGYVWESIGPWRADKSSDKDHQGEGASDLDICRAVVRCFKSIDETFKSGELCERVQREMAVKVRRAKDFLGVAVKDHYIAKKKQEKFVLHSLTSKGRELFHKLHDNQAAAE